MSFKVTPAGQTATPNAHQLKNQEIRAGKTPSARDRALAAAYKGSETPQKTPEPLSIPEVAQALQANSEASVAPPVAPNTPIETQAASGQVQNPEASQAATPEAPKTPEPPKEPLSSQYAQLARKERALRAKALELKQREDAFKAKTDPQTPPQTSNGIPLEEFKKNPWKFMQDNGVTYDQITKAALEAPTPEQQALNQTIESLKAEIETLKSEQTKAKTTWEDNQKNQYQQALNQIKSEVTSLVSANPEFETIKATGSVPDVVELIEKTFQEDGVLLNVEDAAKQVEEYLVEEAYKLSQLKKIQSRLKPAQATATAASPKAPGGTDPKQSQSPTTLTNAISTSTQLSRYERALAAAKHGSNWRDKI